MERRPTMISRSSVLVPPSRPTPYEVLPLTHGSVMAGLNTLVASHALVFDPPPPSAEGRGGSGAAMIDSMRQSLAEVLVPYYPLAGRIVENEAGWEVRCDGRGAVFVVTTMPDIVDDLYTYAPDPAPVAPPVVQQRQFRYQATPPVGEAGEEKEVLVPPVEEKREVVVVTPPPTLPEAIRRHHQAPIPALAVHLTDLGPGGLVLCIQVCRELCGTSGLVHFLSGWAEIARGQPRVSVAPVWPVRAQEPAHHAATSFGRVHFPSFGDVRGPSSLPGKRNDAIFSPANPDPPTPHSVAAVAGAGVGPAFYEQGHPRHIDGQAHHEGDDDRFGNIGHAYSGDRDDGFGFGSHAGRREDDKSGDATATPADLVASILGASANLDSNTLLRLDVPFDLVASLAGHLRAVEGVDCSAAHALAAHVWRERTRALHIPLDARARLFFACDLDENHPMAYHGAFKYNCVASAKVADLLEMPLAWAAERVKAAERSLAHHASFVDCTEEFKHAHRNAETLLFTELPPAHELDQRLDFGAPIGKPHLPRGLLHFPAEVNVAAVARPTPPNNPPSLHIFFNNVPFAHADDLRRFICHPAFLLNTPSRM